MCYLCFKNIFCFRRYVAVGVVGECIIAAGGYDGGAHLSSVESYDPFANVWSLKFPMRSPRSNCSSAVLNDFFYVIGMYAQPFHRQKKLVHEHHYTHTPLSA